MPSCTSLSIAKSFPTLAAGPALPDVEKQSPQPAPPDRKWLCRLLVISITLVSVATAAALVAFAALTTSDNPPAQDTEQATRNCRNA